MLHLLGVEHEKLTYRFMGRDFRLTDVAGVVRRELLDRHRTLRSVQPVLVCRPRAGSRRRFDP